MFGRKQKEIDRLRAKVAELESELRDISNELLPPVSFDHFLKEPPRNNRKHGGEPELSAEEYKRQVLKPLGYKFVESKPDQWMGATRDEWKVEATPAS